MKASLLVASLSLFASCTPVEYEDHWMDSPSTQDASLSDPSYLVSTRIPEPTEAQKNTPVVVAAHGFGSATPEWDEFQAYMQDRGVLVSNVLLGGHGRSLDAWLETDRFDWGQPILDEYRALADQGYSDISLALLSTAAPLWLQQMIDGEYDELPAPKRVLMASPFVVSYDKRLYVAPIIGPVLNNVPGANNEWEKERFYTNKPHPIFPSLMDALNTAAGQLDGEGVQLKGGTTAHVFYAERETTIDGEGVTKLETGLHGDEPVEVIRLDSRWHSWIRAVGRARTAEESAQTDDDGNKIVFTDDDDAIQQEQFEYMLELLNLN